MCGSHKVPKTFPVHHAPVTFPQHSPKVPARLPHRYLSLLLSGGEGVLQLVHLQPEAAALGLQPVPVHDQLGRARHLVL